MRRLAALAILAAACGPDPELVAERDRLQNQVEKLQKENDRLEREADQLHARVRKLQEKVDSLERQAALDRLGLEEGQRLVATIQTSLGDIHCELWPDKAPLTVENFVGLAEGTRAWTDPDTGREVRRPLYDGTLFHRVIPKFMIQGGDPKGDGSGGPGYTFADEIRPDVRFDEPGLLAMANRGPNTNGSQFFITDRSTPHHLDGKHTIFGKCGDADVVERIATVPTGANNRPLKDVVIRHVRIDRE